MIIKEYKIIQTNYNRCDINTFFKITDTLKKYVFLGNKDDFMKMHFKNFVKEVDLNTLKKVYFMPSSEFPRFKLSEFTKIKKCLKPEKADLIISSELKVSNYYLDEIIIKSPSTNNCYLLHFDNINSYRYQDAFNKKDIKPVDVLNKLIELKHIEDDCKIIFIGKPCYINQNDQNIIDVLEQTSLPFILDNDFDRIISDTQKILNYDDLKMISEFLSSSDTATVELGMKLLLNYNVLEKACTIGLTILKYHKNISCTNAVNSVGFKNLLSSLKLNRNDLLNFRENNTIHYLNIFYKISKNNEDKDNARKIVLSIIKDSIMDQINNYKVINETFNIKYTLELE